MKAWLTFLGSVAAALAFNTSALSANTVVSTISNVTEGQAALPQVAQPARLKAATGLTDIVNTFNPDPNNAYVPNAGPIVSGASSEFGLEVLTATPFTPDRDYAAKSIRLALSHFSGTNLLAVSLNADANGLPGRVLKAATVRNLPLFHTCCLTVSLDSRAGFPLSANTRYWLVAKASKRATDATGVWNWNSLGLKGEVARYLNGSWVSYPSNTLPAFSIQGE